MATFPTYLNLPTGGSTGPISGNWYTITSSTTTTTGNVYWAAHDDDLVVHHNILSALQVDRTYRLPDGSRIEIDAKGNYNVIDKDARVVYQACRIRAFNRFLNASELLEQFISDLAPLGVKQDQVLKVPVEAFINWLILKAAAADGDELPPQRHNHRCAQCKRFLSRRLVAQGVNFCSSLHLDRYMNRLALTHDKQS